MRNCLPVLVMLQVFISFLVSESFAIAQSPTGVEKFASDNLVAWCIVPFDDQKRTPEQRASMMEKLGIRKYAYDYRAEHVPEFDAEMEAIKRHGIELVAWWFPGTLGDEASNILAVLKRHKIKTQLWVTGGGTPTKSPEGQRARVVAEAARLKPIAEAAKSIGCTIGLYNHGNWFGEPENQIEIVEELKQQGIHNVGIVYNQHHGHEHVARFPELLKKMQPYLLALNLNGMTKDGDKQGHKIVPIGQGELDRELIRIIRDSDYAGPIGILNHTQENAEHRLQDNLDGLRWVVEQLSGDSTRPRPQPKTWKRPSDWDAKQLSQALPIGQTIEGSKSQTTLSVEDAALVEAIAKAAGEKGDAQKGAQLFASATSACLSCHRLGQHGGTVGPDLSRIGKEQTAEQLIESVLWPQRQIKPDYLAHSFLLTDGRIVKGVILKQTDQRVTLRDAATAAEIQLDIDDIESRQRAGSMMPEGVAATWNLNQRADLIAFLSDLGKHEKLSAERLAEVLERIHPGAPTEFQYARDPLHPDDWPSWQLPVNRERIYDFYAKEARFFREFCPPGRLVPEFPGLDGGTAGHWGNQSESTWADGRWNQTQLGSLQSGVFHAGKLTVPRAVCVQLGDRQELFACFDSDSCSYAATWKDAFLKFSDVRHGFMHGLMPGGERIEEQSKTKPNGSIEYQGFYRHGNRTLFAYRSNGVEMLDAAWVRDGKLERTVAPKAEHPLRDLTKGGPAQWPQVIEVQGKLGKGRPYAVDTIPVPFDNPWKSLMFLGDHDFLPDGSAVVCTMQGDVWKVTGLDESLNKVAWRRIASGLHHALGLTTVGEEILVLGRDQITRLHDLNGDEEIDFYECFSRACETSPAGHDFTCGLWRDSAGYLYTVSGKQGLMRISPDGKQATVLATGLRNSDGLGLASDGTVTIPSSEGDWVPASMICALRPGSQVEPAHFGHKGPIGGKQPDLPLVYLPRGLDNSSGGQVSISSDRWGPLQGQMIHLSYGTASHFLLLRDEVQGQMQGAVVPLAGEFLSGAHRGRFHPRDGQLYVSGMGGWGNYSPDDGCFHRVRYTGDRVQLPVSFHVHENGVSLKFTERLDRETASNVNRHWAQCWNYRYSGGYGSPEFSALHTDLRGHDILSISQAVVSADGYELFLEIPDLQPTNQLHLLIETSPGHDVDVYMTVHRLDTPKSDIPGYVARPKTILPHPMAVDMARATRTKRNPFEKLIPQARSLTFETGSNLTFKQRVVKAKAGEAIQLTLVNTDVVPHNWALLKPGTLERNGDLANKLIADPEAVAKQYIPDSPDVLAYTDIVAPHSRFVIYFRAPDKPGRYPYLCTFPGHWMVMNGELVVE